MQFDQLKRHEFVTVLLGGAVAWSPGASAQRRACRWSGSCTAGLRDFSAPMFGQIGCRTSISGIS